MSTIEEPAEVIEAYGEDARLNVVLSDLRERIPRRIDGIVKRAIADYQVGTLSDANARNYIAAIAELQLTLNEAERDRKKISKTITQTHGGTDGN